MKSFHLASLLSSITAVLSSSVDHLSKRAYSQDCANLTGVQFYVNLPNGDVYFAGTIGRCACASSAWFEGAIVNQLDAALLNAVDEAGFDEALRALNDVVRRPHYRRQFSTTNRVTRRSQMPRASKPAITLTTRRIVARRPIPVDMSASMGSPSPRTAASAKLPRLSPRTTNARKPEGASCIERREGAELIIKLEGSLHNGK